MSSILNSSQEFCEILNAFPVLNDKFESLDIDISDNIEGETFYEYFARHSMSKIEISILIKKLNSDIKYFLKKGELPKLDRKIQIGHEEIDLIE